jgi:glycolate oxidase iron-sulfur subunit
MQDENALREVANDCVHCGFCLPACPTYQLWAEEMDSPRGRIYLVNQILDGAELSDTARLHFDRCLGCMACMTACPSGVQYDQLIEAARVWAEHGNVQPAVASRAPGAADETVADVRGADAGEGDGGGPAAPRLPPAGKRPVRERAARTAIFSLFPYPGRLRAATGPLRVMQRAGIDRLVSRSKLQDLISPVLGAALRLAPGPVPASPRLPERVPARGRRRAVVGMLTGCVQSVFFPQVNAATARVLAAEGCDVIIPRGQGCCGALSLHSGREAEAAGFARRTIAAFGRAGVDAVVVNSAGCGSAMKEYGRLLGSEVGLVIRDFSEFLTELGPVAPRHPLPVRAAYHDACHLGHAQGITRQPRELLRAIPELDLVELADAGNCCGSAGVYNLVQPEAAAELGARKAEAVLAADAPLLISANPGCSLQIAAALAARGERISVAHVAEVLDASVHQVPLPASEGLRAR